MQRLRILDIKSPFLLGSPKFQIYVLENCYKMFYRWYLSPSKHSEIYNCSNILWKCKQNPQHCIICELLTQFMTILNVQVLGQGKPSGYQSSHEVLKFQQTVEALLLKLNSPTPVLREAHLAQTGRLLGRVDSTIIEFPIISGPQCQFKPLKSRHC